MAKSQYEVCADVLRRLHKAGVLDHVVLIGSWCLLFYRDYFQSDRYVPSIRTRDIDILIPLPPRFPDPVDLPAILGELGLVMDLKGSKGYMQFLHPDLMLEFLVPERGRGSDKPYDVPSLGINAQPLRYLDLLLRDAIKLKFERIPIQVPHPANFAIHKLIISTRRKAKAEQDRAQAVKVLGALRETGDQGAIRSVMDSIPVSWLRTAMAALKTSGDETILAGM